MLRRPVPGLRQGLLEVYKARGTDFASAVRMSGCLQAALGLLLGGGETAGGEDLSLIHICGSARSAGKSLG